MARYSNDPRWIITKFVARGADGTMVPKGTKAFYFPLTRTLLTGQAAEDAAERYESERADEEFTNRFS